MIELREYQNNVYKKVQEQIKSGKRRILVVMPCRTGKSYIFGKMAEMASERGGNTLVLIHRHELRDQHADLLADIPNVDVGMVITESHHKRKTSPTVIITDEAHLSMAESYRTVIDMYPYAYVIGFTATPVRLDGKPLGDLYDSIVIGPSVSWAIENRFMSDFDYYVAQLFDLSSLNKARGDFTESSMEAIMMSDTAKKVYGNVIREWESKAGGKQTIVYCVTITHAEEMAERFRSYGYSAEAVSSKTKKNERERIFERFRIGETTLLCNVGIISEGVTFNNVYCCLLLRPTASHALYWQQAMRCMTYVDGKKAIILDCVDNYKRNPMLDDDVVWSIDKKAQTKSRDSVGSCGMKLCENCLGEIPSASKVCPICNADLTSSPDGTEIKELRQYNLVLIERKKQSDAAEKRKAMIENIRKYKLLKDCKTLEDFKRYGREKGYKDGWAYFRYKDYRKKMGF